VKSPLQRSLSQTSVTFADQLFPYSGCSSTFRAIHEIKQQKLLQSPTVELESTKIWTSSDSPAKTWSNQKN
jgi:hypothetical protein